MRGGPASADGAGEDAGKVAVKPTLGDKFFHGAREPVAAVAIAEALFEERFKNTGSAVRVVPDEALGVKPGPILFKDAVVGFEIAPHFGLRVRSNDGDLGDVEFERSESAQIFGDGFRRFGGQADDVVALGVEAGAIEARSEFEGGLDLFVLVHVLEDFLVEAFDAEERAFHAAFLPLIEVTKEKIDTRLDKPARTIAGEAFDDGFGVGGKIAEVLVEHKDEAHAVLRVEAEDAIERIEGDGLRMRGEGGGLAKSAAETAAARRKENANRNGPAAGETEFGDEWRMLDFVEGQAEELGEGLFAVAGEDAIEGRLDGGAEGAVIPCPELANAGGAGFAGHIEDVVGLFEVEGETDRVPTAAEFGGEFGARGIFENRNAGNVLSKEAQAKRNAARHAEAPSEVAGSVFAEIIVEARIAAAGGEKDARHRPLVRNTARGRIPFARL